MDSGSVSTVRPWRYLVDPEVGRHLRRLDTQRSAPPGSLFGVSRGNLVGLPKLDPVSLLRAISVIGVSDAVTIIEGSENRSQPAQDHDAALFTFLDLPGFVV